MKRKQGVVFYLGLILLVGLFSLGCTGEVDDYASTGVLFELASGARAMGMGGTYIGLADEGNAVITNPAGLGFHQGGEISTTYSRRYRLLNYNSAVAALGPVGVVGLKLASDSVEVTDRYGVETGDLASFSSTGVVAGAGLSTKTIGLGRGPNEFALGFSFRSYDSSLYTTSGTGYGFSLSALYRLELGEDSFFQLGGVVPGTLLLDPSRFDFPLGRIVYRDENEDLVHEEVFGETLGAGGAIRLSGGRNTATTFAVDWRRDSGLSAGLEQEFWFLSVRLGLAAGGELSAGGGLNLSELGFSEFLREARLDGAYSWQKGLGATWAASFKLDF